MGKYRLYVLSKVAVRARFSHRFLFEGNVVSNEIDKAAEKVETVATNEGPRMLDQVSDSVVMECL